MKQTNEYCYLGVMITACGSFSLAMKTLYKKGLKAMFCLLNNVNKTKQLSAKILLDLFDKMISPVILYNCEIWGASLLKKKSYSEQDLVENLFHLQFLQEDVHMTFMKIALGVNSKATNFAVRSELGRFPLHIKIYTAMLKYWNRLNDLIDNPIIVDARIVNEDIHLSKDYTFSWLSSIEMPMKVTGYSQHWNNDNYSSKSFPNEFFKKLKSMFVDDWKNEMILKTSSEQAGQGKLSFYCKVKKEFKME